MELFNEGTIRDLILLSEHGENANDFSDDKSFMDKFLTAKALIDRWGNIPTYLLCSEENKEFIIDSLNKNPYYRERNSDCFDHRYGDCIKEYKIWSMDIFFSEMIPMNRVVVVSVDEYGNLNGDVPSRSVSSFII